VSAERLPFARRNFRFLLQELRTAPGDVTVFLNAPAISWDIRVGENESVIRSVLARGGTRLLKVRARAFLIAAGALESTRILLEMERQTHPQLFGERAAVGHYLSDHLSCGVAEVLPADRAFCAQMFAPRFRSGRMCSVRFIERALPGNLPRCFFHFIFADASAGFELAKTLLAAMQARRVPKGLFSSKKIAGAVLGFGALGWTRIARSRLYIPRGTPCRLQLDIEQAPAYSNCIRLSDTLDAHGRPEAIINWRVSDVDYRAIRTLASRFLALWPQDNSQFPRLSLAIEDGAGPKPHDAYHPVGTCRIGVDEEAVVDPELRVRGVSNLSLVSTAVFPSAGTANPTFSMLCLASAVAERVRREVGPTYSTRRYGEEMRQPKNTRSGISFRSWRRR
jgi:choline dehydrogenase-like flavoprotein